jgi:hypothetical protein
MTQRGEEGITLSELLIALVITAIILVPLTGAMFVGLRSDATTMNRVQESASANLLSSYFSPDVQNTVAVALNTAEPAAACGGGALGNVGMLLTTHASTTAEPTVSTVSYYRGSGPNTTMLYRRVCSAGTASQPVRVIRNLSGAPVFTCNPNCASWTSVKVVVQQKKTPDVGAPYTSTVEAARRNL